jgi:hypothetical protein
MVFIKTRFFAVVFGLFFVFVSLISPKFAVEMVFDVFEKLASDLADKHKGIK